MKIRQHIRFTGRVQGVGFRFSAYHLANSLGLTGWVYNDWDDSVQMEVQGEKDLIEKMIEHLDSDVFIQIERIERENISIKENEAGFSIEG